MNEPGLEAGLRLIRELEAYAVEHYEAWGNLAVETWEVDRYLDVLRRVRWDLDRAKQSMREELEGLSRLFKDTEEGWGGGGI